mmetsp:Transcript_10025/g.14809  ORF Transcript_10025/g.14809 Transcript_10025/m.14809 type:complete len:579 (+) Transcript_10025:82-1818(+)
MKMSAHKRETTIQNQNVLRTQRTKRGYLQKKVQLIHFPMMVMMMLIMPSSHVSVSSFTMPVQTNTIKKTKKIHPSLRDSKQSSSPQHLHMTQNDDSDDNTKKQSNNEASKRQMLSFAIPALGIYLTSPLLSNIDNAFVGRTTGTAGLAALSPATICTDQMLYLFSFLSRATTGIVSSAYGSADDEESEEGRRTQKAKDAASAPFTVSLVTGILLTFFYMWGGTSLLLSALLRNNSAKSEIFTNASSYVLLRGISSWAALSQSICLSILMATRDAITPLKIIALSALVNVIGDALFCVWPFRGGCAGAAAATSIATLLSYGCMIGALKKKKLLPQLRKPKLEEVKGLLDFTGPLLAITLTRLAGFLAMQKSAIKLGVTHLATYQLCLNVVIFFLLFGEPLSQLSQTKLPALLKREEDGKDKEIGVQVAATFKSILVLAVYAAIGVGGVAFGSVAFGSGLFSSDVAVQSLARSASPAVFMSVFSAVMAVAVDGALMASRDFGFMLTCGLFSFALQLLLLQRHCTSINFIFGTFTMRLGSYAILGLMRVFVFGGGRLGRVIRSSGKDTGEEGVEGLVGIKG